MTNILKYTDTRIVGARKITTKVRLSDDCNNGYATFAITADIYENDKVWGWKWCAGGGCCHEEIALFQESKPN